jgi:hypothetical protein
MAPPRVDDLLRRLLVQCPPERAADVASVVADYRSGIVLTGPKPRAMVRHLRRLDYTGPILCDAARYTGRHRLAAGAGLRASWTAEQHDLGLVALTDSGYLAAGDWPGLRKLLIEAERQPPPLLVTLPLASGWFAVPMWIDRLVAVLDEARLPVAIVILGESFDTERVTKGFVRLLRAAVPIVLLQADVGAVGAICHGAHAAALGSSSGLFVPALLGHHRPAVLARIVERTPDLAQLWPCHCRHCAGSVPTNLSPDGIYLHSLHAQLKLGDLLTDQRHDITAMHTSWREHCHHALAVHHDVAEVMELWETPLAPRWWRQVVPPRVAGSVPSQNLDEDAPRMPYRLHRRTS